MSNEIKTISINDYANAEYKTFLTIGERSEMVKAIVNQVKVLFDKNIFGLTRYTICRYFCRYCTNIDVETLSVEDQWDFYAGTDVMKYIAQSLSQSVYDDIQNEIDTGIRYAISMNPDVNNLLKKLGELMSTLSQNSGKVSDEGIHELVSLFVQQSQIGNGNEN